MTYLAGHKIPMSVSHSTVLPDMDFETYSSAGYNFDEELNKWVSIVKSPPHGIGAVGAPAYSEHPSTEVLSLAYDLKEGVGARLWVPGMPPPQDLFDHIKNGGLLEACNSAFEYYIWVNVCTPRMGWPELPFEQLRCVAAKSRAHALPGSLGDTAKALEVEDLKIEDGKRLIKKLCCPRQPTKKDQRRRILPTDPTDFAEFGNLYDYNIGDIKSESAISQRVPDLSSIELELWLLDQGINFRGMQIDTESVKNCIAIVNEVIPYYNAELNTVTGGAIQTVSQNVAIVKWLAEREVITKSVDADHVAALLKRDDLPTDARRALEIKELIGSSSVKKLFAIDRRVSLDGRIRDIFCYHGAATGRFAGRGPQPQNLPNSGPQVKKCPNCLSHFRHDAAACAWCAYDCSDIKAVGWNPEAAAEALKVISHKNVSTLKQFFGDVITVICGVLRSLFCAAEGKDLICSDYSAIEAVVIAMLAGEQWRIDVFRTHGKIYEMSAAKITGVPFEEMMEYKRTTKDHHPLRKSIGKVAELASAYQGGVGAWKLFGAEKHFNSDAEIKAAVDAWRKESPMIVKFWYGLEDAARSAIQQPGECFSYRDITYGVKDDVLYCQLPSGRNLTYHKPRLHPEVTPWGKEVLKITFMGYNSDYKKGPKGWMRLDTYGGKLAENVTQAAARDIMTHAMPKLDAAGYPIVLHVHDELISEVPEGFGTIEEFESIMATMPSWAHDWPIKAAGGWRGKRYCKD